MSAAGICRYVAVGDSQTEGLHDYHQDGRLRGWADRFAERLAARHPDLLYANLAVRGKRTAEILRDQLEPALALMPDLVTVVAGVNDAVRPGTDLDEVGNDLEAMYRAFAAAGCTVMSCTFPLPAIGLTRRAAPRFAALNRLIRAVAERRGVLLVELEDVPVASDPRLWSPDRIHLNPDGHSGLAAAFEATLRGEAVAEWMPSLPPLEEPARARQWMSEAAWLARFVAPKIVRMIRGRSSGDGRSAKRPELGPVG